MTSGVALRQLPSPEKQPYHMRGLGVQTPGRRINIQMMGKRGACSSDGIDNRTPRVCHSQMRYEIRPHQLSSLATRE